MNEVGKLPNIEHEVYIDAPSERVYALLTTGVGGTLGLPMERRWSQGVGDRLRCDGRISVQGAGLRRMVGP